MRLKKASSVDYVHQFSDIAYMKFRPKKLNIIVQRQKPEQQNVLMSRLKTFIKWRSPQSISQSRVTQGAALSRSSSQVSIKSVSLQNGAPGSTILFLQKISPQHFLIGNQNQIDLVFIGGVVGSFIDTQSLWELNIGQPIKNLAIDSKKGLIAIQTNAQIVVYRYDYKKIKQRPQFFTGIKTKAEGKYMRFMRDSILTVFYDNFIEVYVIEQQKMRRKMCKQVKQAAEMELFQVPNVIQNILNIFYIKKSVTSKNFQLWYLQLNLRGSQVQITEMMKVYDIKQGLQSKIKLQNYSKQIFLMNMGFQILAVKRGYIIDSAYLNIQEDSTFLHYIGNNRLLHLSPSKAQIYKFQINFESNPPRIAISPLDSIQIIKPISYEYIGALQIFDRNFAVFYQIVPQYNRRTRGQITYCFAMTKHVTLQEKVKEIFTFGLGTPLKDVSFQLIEERVDMALKIGLNTVQIYLELWNRTNKTQVQQFKFLLDTLDYDTIKKEIQKKLKKSSMLWRQIYKIQQSCFDMIRDNLFSSRCSQQVVKSYLTSHLLLRKLQLYKDISLIQKEANKDKAEQQGGDALKINIQNYNKYLKVDVKVLFLQLIQEYCFENKDVLMHIRVFLKSFRFIFRIIYKQLLEEIVSTTKNSLIKLLQNLPQLLPYKHILREEDQAMLYEGVWQQITTTQWQKNLHVEAISTIDNRQVIAQIPKSLWFRRNFLTQHDMTGKSKQQILRIHRFNNSDQIFYFFISNVFEYVSEQSALKKIINFVQKNYQKMPGHLHQKIFLYRQIYQFFKDNQIQKSNQKVQNFYDLLQMRDFQLFRQFFQFQKVKKGCLLREIKQIYQRVGGTQETYVLSSHLIDEENWEYQLAKDKHLGKGIVWFNQSILSYFSSDLSEISDLKYILNRINNAKREFHANNEHLIYVLVQSVELKLKIGSGDDVPISEILLYLENIPLTIGSPILKQLQKIQKISEQVERFQQIKINMTISQITKNCQIVINALINQEIKKRKVMEVTSAQQMKEISYDIIAQIQVIKEKIYALEYSDLTFFVYLTKIMEEVHMIHYAAELLEDPWLKQHYSIKDLKVVQDLILYMYKMKLTQNPKYIDNEYYLTELLQILPEDNQCRIYISCELQYAKILSAPNNPVEYPLTDKSDGISIVQLQQRIQQLPGEFLLQIDIENLHKLMNTMQQICYQDFQANYYTSINQIYEVIILKLIEDNKIIDSIPLVKTLLHLPNNQYAAIFPLFYIDLLSQQLTVECKRLLLKAVSYMYNEPLQLLRIVQELMVKVFTTQQRDRYFKQLAQKSEQYNKNYNPKNPILDPVYLQLIRNQEMQSNFKNMIDQCGNHLVRTKQDFKTFQFSLLFIILTQQPFALGKYIFCRRYQTNYKVMRSFLSYVIKEQIFDSMRILQFGRRLFNIILEASQSILTLQSITSQYATASMDQNIQFQQMLDLQPPLPDDDQFVKKAKVLESKLQKCILAFDKKTSSVLVQLNKNGPIQQILKKKQRIQKQLTNPIDLSEKAPSEYPFGDSDDDYGQEEKFEDFTKSLRRRKKHHKQFNPSLQRTLLLNRTTKNYALFMSSQVGYKQQPLYMSSRAAAGQHKKLKNTNTHAVDGKNSLRLSGGLMVGKSQSTNQYPKRSGYASGRISEQICLTQSVDGFTNFVYKSGVVKKRPANDQDNLDQSPMMNHSIEQSQEFFDEEIKNLEKQFSDSDIEIQKDQVEGLLIQQDFGFHVNVRQIDQNAFLPVQTIKTMIVDSATQQGEQFRVDLSQLSMQQDKDNGEFTNYLIQLIRSIYDDADIKPKTRLKLIKQIQSLYPDIGMSKQFMDIYIRFQSYHSKYDISIPINQMFPIQFIFSDSKQPKQLFDSVAQIIVSLVDESNIYKISKIIHLAFKASSFQQEFFFSYLCLAAEKFDTSNISQNQLNMQLQKLTALIEKLPIHIITERGFRMIQNMKNKERKDSIVQVVINYVQKKRNKQQVQKFKEGLIKF